MIKVTANVLHVIYGSVHVHSFSVEWRSVREPNLNLWTRRAMKVRKENTLAL